MTVHALIVAALACLSLPGAEAAACLDADPALRARAETLAGLAAEAAPPRCLQFRSCGRR